MTKKLLKFAKSLHPGRVSELALYLLKDEAVSGKFILGATTLALVAANTGFSAHYQALWATHLSFGIGDWTITNDLKHWVNEALMSIFFLVVGLELKRELIRGELRRLRTASLPFAAAIGGMLVPALIYTAYNGSSGASNGWAIPMATDIAFAVGILALLGKGIPASLRLFLLTLAIVDDIGAVVVIALFYSGGISVYPLFVAALICVALITCGRSRKLSMPLYVIGCIMLWLAVNGSGAHASIAGTAMGLLAPLEARRGKASIASRTEHFMIPVSTLIVVPLFAFANTGVVLSVHAFRDDSVMPVAFGIITGLVIGKVVGIVGASWLMVRLRLADLPNGANWGHMAGIGLLAGIGFTVSIFVTELAFDSEQLITLSKLSIFLASAISGGLGLLVLMHKTRHRRTVSKV